ncbi:molybdopterin-guanine dinucleotide biosynthesis protein MobB, partial [bacterium]|nr:molybdopterin-guanine dinucleotide biosynthesis protein MobB [bacterium]
AHKGVGKTALACQILKRLKGFGAIKTTVSKENISVTSKNEATGVPGKDTALLKGAGAEKVVLVSSPRKDLDWALKVALGMVSECKGVIIEGTSVLDYIKPDVAILIKAKGKRMKESAKRALKKVDLVISSDEFDEAVRFVKEKMK